MTKLHQIMLLCRPGFEKECATELLDYANTLNIPAYISLKDNTGYAHLVSAEHLSLVPLLEEIDFKQLSFTRQWFACGHKIENLPEKNRTLPLIEAAGQLQSELGSGFSDIELSYADTNEGKSVSRFCNAFKPHWLNALKQNKLIKPRSPFRLHLFFIDSSTAWAGVSLVDNASSDAMGIPRLRMPKAAPSRSTLKLEEAIHWFIGEQEERRFKPGMTAVDLGAAPGGWSWQLVKRGLLVTAIDNGPMDRELMQSGMVEHLRVDAFTYKPGSKVDWLLCDMAERPLHVSRLVTRWFEQRDCRAAIFNLKLPMKKRLQAVNECRQLLHSSLNRLKIPYSIQIKQLYHDREEVTVCILTDTSTQ